MKRLVSRLPSAAPFQRLCLNVSTVDGSSPANFNISTLEHFHFQSRVAGCNSANELTSAGRGLIIIQQQRTGRICFSPSACATLTLAFSSYASVAIPRTRQQRICDSLFLCSLTHEPKWSRRRTTTAEANHLASPPVWLSVARLMPWRISARNQTRDNLGRERANANVVRSSLIDPTPETIRCFWARCSCSCALCLPFGSGQVPLPFYTSRHAYARPTKALTTRSKRLSTKRFVVATKCNASHSACEKQSSGMGALSSSRPAR